MYDHSKYAAIGEHILDSLDRYAQEGVPTGGFLEAVLSNNLMEAFGRADMFNRAVMFEICQYVYNELPGDCHGSLKAVNDYYEYWAKRREEARLAQEA